MGPRPQSPHTQTPNQKPQYGQSCDRCHQSKRKCDRDAPCFTCKRYGYVCTYSAVRKKSNRRRVPRPVSPADYIRNEQDQGSTLQGQDVSPLAARETIESSGHGREKGDKHDLNEEIAETTSGILSFRRWVNRVDPSAAMGLHATGWNLGLSEKLGGERSDVKFKRLSTIISFEQANILSHVYFKNVNVVYGFLTSEEFYKFIDLEYKHDGVNDSESIISELDSYQAVICGAVALGSLFSRNNPNILPFTDRQALEQTLLMRAREQLEHAHILDGIQPNPVGLYCVIGWSLRMLYLRATASPNIAWLAICRTLNLAEIIGLHDETKWAPLNHDPNRLRHIFWCLEILNTWLSLDAGRSKIKLTYVRCHYPTVEFDTDFTPALASLYDTTRQVVAVNDCEPETVYEVCHKVVGYKAPHPEIALDRGYSAIIILRRMSSLKVSDETVRMLVNAACDALIACRELALSGQPWWLVATVPFQLLCMVLKIDNNAYTPLISQILDTMVVIAQQFRTDETSNAIRVTKTLLNLFKQRKERDTADLEKSISHFDESLDFSNGLSTPFVPLMEDELYPWTLDDLLDGSLSMNMEGKL